MTNRLIPDYVASVQSEYRVAKLRLVHQSRRPLPDRQSPIVLSVVKNEVDRLCDFLRHYRTAGIERFIFVDNGSNDGTRELLSSQADVDLYLRPGKFDWKLKQGWLNKLVSLTGYARWYVAVDADEHIVFDGFPERTLRDVVVLMEHRGIKRVRGLLVDMYADGPLLESTYPTHGRLLDAYPYFDAHPIVEEKFESIISVKGGPRMRAFGPTDPNFRPELTKYPLFTIAEDECLAHPHHIWPCHANFLSDRYLALVHYKFLPGLAHKLQTAIKEGSYWNSSAEYRCYWDTFSRRPDLSLMSDLSTRLTAATDLVEHGLIESLAWPNEPGVAERMRAACRRRRAELDSADGLSQFESTRSHRPSRSPQTRPARAQSCYSKT